MKRRILLIALTVVFLLGARRRAINPWDWSHGYYAPPLKGEIDPTVSLSISRILDVTRAAGYQITAEDVSTLPLMIFRQQGSFGRAVTSTEVAHRGFLFIPVHSVTIYLHTTTSPPSSVPYGDEFVLIFDDVVAGECQ